MASDKSYAAKYKHEQERYSKRLKEELERFRQEYGASMAELAEGLGISRQKLYDFMNKPGEKLSIDRANILGLWDCLTDPEEISKKSLSEQERAKRNELWKAGSANLLMASGFLPPSSSRSFDSQSLDIEHPQIRRVVSRLSSKWIEDDILRAYLADNFLEQILERGRLDRASYTEPVKEPENWPTQAPLNSTEQSVITKFRTEIKKMANSGKNQFVAAELFELYQSILEHETLNRDFKEKLSVTDCQFQTLSIVLYGKNEDLDKVCKVAEKRLTDLLNNSKKEINEQSIDAELQSPPLIEVAISSSFFDGEGNQKNVTWRYGSTATHVENMLVAIKNGLGYPLNVTGFFVRATGRSEKSLAKVSIALAEENQENQSQKVYQGWWVGSNTILGILKSVVDAMKRWLSDKSISLSSYYKICQKLAEVDENLFNGMQALYERAPYPKDIHIERDYIEKIFKIEQELIEEYTTPDEHLKKHFSYLEYKGTIAKLMQIHLALIEGDLQKARDILPFADGILAKAKSQRLSNNLLILTPYASACSMLYKFLTGDKEFLVGKLWRHRSRYRLDDRLKDLQKYVEKTCTITFDVYLFMSQVYGTVGYLEFYSSHQEDEVRLKDSVNHLLTAAYYSSRIGHARRSAYWLAYASRVQSRLGNVAIAQDFSKIAERILIDQKPIKLADPDEEKNWAMANILLSNGERLLRIGKLDDALYCFFQALDISTHTGFMRLVADSLYDLYRVSKNIDKKHITVNVGRIKSLFVKLDENGEVWHKNKFTQDIIHLLEKPEQISWSQFSKECQDQAKSIWHSWASQKEDFKEDADKHPIEDEIDRDTFLDDLIGTKDY